MMYINNLGEFSTLADVWKAYPYGGKEGDYVTINGNKVAWNKYTNTWGADTDIETEPSETKEIDGDLYVKGNLRIGGKVSHDNLTTAIVVLDVNSLVEQAMFRITPEQYNTIKMSRHGTPVFIQDVNRKSAEREWGQVISCLRGYTSPSSYIYRVSILHRGDPQSWGAGLSSEEHAIIYNIDILDYLMGDGNYSCRVAAIKNLY